MFSIPITASEQKLENRLHNFNDDLKIECHKLEISPIVQIRKTGGGRYYVTADPGHVMDSLDTATAHALTFLGDERPKVGSGFEQLGG